MLNGRFITALRNFREPSLTALVPTLARCLVSTPAWHRTTLIYIASGRGVMAATTLAQTYITYAEANIAHQELYKPENHISSIQLSLKF